MWEVDCTGKLFRKKAIEKTILRILRPSAFSHSLGQERKSACPIGMSGLAKPDIGHLEHARQLTMEPSQAGRAERQPGPHIAEFIIGPAQLGRRTRWLIPATRVKPTPCA
jgi:hypothetical protein